MNMIFMCHLRKFLVSGEWNCFLTEAYYRYLNRYLTEQEQPSTSSMVLNLWFELKLEEEIYLQAWLISA